MCVYIRKIIKNIECIRMTYDSSFLVYIKSQTKLKLAGWKQPFKFKSKLFYW